MADGTDPFSGRGTPPRRGEPLRAEVPTVEVPAVEVKVADTPTGFRLPDLGIATSLGQLTVSLFRSKTATAAQAAAPAQSPSPQGRLIFAIDATASRERTWDQACHIQAEMFDAVAKLGRLDVQLVHFRGLCDFGASPWYQNAEALSKRMTAVHCLSGQTQLRRVLAHALRETRQRRVNAVIYVGDAVEEDLAPLLTLAGELGMLGTPVFVFHEAAEETGSAEDEKVGPQVEACLRQIARLSGGAYCPFDIASAGQLRGLLRAVALYAVAGRLALPDLRANRARATEGGRIESLLETLYQQMNWRPGR
ncbi:MAG: VWA domain-containing protein [Rhodospirillaceae bacterium]